MEPTVISENTEYFVISKPSGWITNDADTTTTQPVLQTWARENLKYEINGNKELRDGIVHRLDKETSGIILVAKSESAFWSLQKEFKDRIVSKTYVCLVHGQLDPKEGTIDAPVGRLPWRRDRFGVLPGGRDAVTSYEAKSSFTKDGENFTLVECKPKTGRTHQIRIHMKHIGHPIVADEFYAGRKTARNDRRWCSRLFLHAKAIEFIDPSTKTKVNYEAELPKDLKDVLEYLS